MISINNIKINIPKYPKFILDTLEKKGFKAYIVGGCVRDQLLNKKVSDFDITTNAKPDDIKKIFKKTIDTGVKHGTVSVLFKDDNNTKFYAYEITTFRTEGEYKDGRHPESVCFVNDLYEDLSRRDFTINAFAYNDKEGFVDKFDGLSDLNNKLIRAVGNPIDRYNEDALRMIRAIRFASKLNFDIEKSTLDAIKICSENLSKVSKERIQIELTKILTSDNPDFIKLIFDLNLSKYITNNFNEIKLSKLIKTDDVSLSYASLLYNNVDICEKIIKDLKFDNNTLKNVVSILSYKKNYIDFISASGYTDLYKKNYFLKKMVYNIHFDNAYRLIDLISFKENVDLTDDLKILNDICSNNEPIFLKYLNINGNDLNNIGIIGKKVGEVLLSLIEDVHEDKQKNYKDLLISIAKKGAI